MQKSTIAYILPHISALIMTTRDPIVVSMTLLDPKISIYILTYFPKIYITDIASPVWAIPLNIRKRVLPGNQRILKRKVWSTMLGLIMKKTTTLTYSVFRRPSRMSPPYK
jgi:hypothetical protein